MISPTRRSLLLAAATAAAATSFGSKPDSAGIRDRLAALEVSTGGRIGVAGLNTGTGAKVSHRAAERFPFCSTFKLLAAAATLMLSRRDPGLLDRRIDYTKHDLVSYSPITSQHAGSGMTVSALCAAALQYSDNTAANLMIRLLGGPGGVTAFARSIGDDRFRLDRWETALNTAIPGDPRDTTTPAAMMTDLQRLTLGELLGPMERDKLVAWMRGCVTGLKRIRSAAPEGWIVADKTGSGDYGTANDIAVVWPSGQPPIVLAVYFTQEDKGAPVRDDVVGAAARIAFAALG